MNSNCTAIVSLERNNDPHKSTNNNNDDQHRLRFEARINMMASFDMCALILALMQIPSKLYEEAHRKLRSLDSAAVAATCNEKAICIY